MSVDKTLPLKAPNGEKKILLHACCAPCSSAILETLQHAGIEPVIFFCNPNIYPQEEYEKRKSELMRFAAQNGIKFICCDDNHAEWLEKMRGLENEPERGKRCLECFKFRLLKSAKKAKELGIKVFATTLASSRYKNIDQLEEAGIYAQDKDAMFWSRNWRANGLWERRCELLKKYGFYNQSYCGCEFSLRDAQNHKKKQILDSDTPKMCKDKNASGKEEH